MNVKLKKRVDIFRQSALALHSVDILVHIDNDETMLQAFTRGLREEIGSDDVDSSIKLFLL